MPARRGFDAEPGASESRSSSSDDTWSSRSPTADGRLLCGWPEYYSNDTAEGLLYISDPAWVEDDGNYSDLGVHGILLTNKDMMDSIMFTHVTPTNAKSRAGERSNANH